MWYHQMVLRKKKTYLIMKSDFKPYMKADEKFKNKLKNKAL